MSRLIWDAIGERLYETGTKNGVLYVQANGAYENGVAWNGLTGFSESPDGGDATDIYADDTKYLTLRSRENFKGTITAYTYPDEFMQCDGSASLSTGIVLGQQARKPFGFSYVSTVGNDTDAEDHGYKIHLIYGATVSPSSKDYKTINDSPEAIEFSWEIATVPVNVTGFKPTAHLVIDSTKFTTTEQRAKLAAFENIIYGTDAQEAVAATYKATTDATKQAGKTYYTKSGDVYSVFEGDSFVAQTTYYEIDTPARDAVAATTARLPLPDEIKTFFTAA